MQMCLKFSGFYLCQQIRVQFFCHPFNPGLIADNFFLGEFCFFQLIGFFVCTGNDSE